MNILVLGFGAREHAIIQKCAQSKLVDRLYCIPGNGGISRVAICADYKLDDFDGIVEFAKDKKIDLIIVGSEEPLANGIVDRCEKEGLCALGPTIAGARIESSKYFCKLLLQGHGIETAPYRAFTIPLNAKRYVVEKYFTKVRGSEHRERCVIKDNGLARGKGVIIADSKDRAFYAIDHIFQKSRDKIILVEDFTYGWECSFTVLTDGINVAPLMPAVDYKRAHDNDLGPNTGGVGAYAPVPKLTPELFSKMMDIARRVVFALYEDGIRFKGFLYIGFMVTPKGEPTILEINCRLGDPETQVILPLLDSDFVEPCFSAAKGVLKNTDLAWKNEALVDVVMYSAGYPDQARLGDKIYGREKAIEEGALIFDGATIVDSKGNFYTAGGRVLSVVGRCEIMNGNIALALEKARKMAYKAAGHISFGRMNPKNGYQRYRRDIALHV